MAFYPNSKVILTIRDFDSWYDSVINTIYYSVICLMDHWIVKYIVSPYSKELMNQIVFGIFGGIERFHNDKENARKIYQQWNDHVKTFIEKDRLLIYDVKKHGWKELCQFLQIEKIPNDFEKSGNSLPRVNSTKVFRGQIDRFRMLLKAFDILTVAIVGFGFAYAALKLYKYSNA